MENFFTEESCAFLWPVVAALSGKPFPSGHDGAVYFAGSLEEGPIKIGFTRDLYTRFHQLQSSNAGDMWFLAAKRGGLADEARYLDQFAASRIRGEWFERTPAILAEIDRINAAHEADWIAAFA